MSSDPAFVASSKKNFYIFGKAIAFSMSPTIHKAAYRHYGLPHDYQIYMTEDVEGFAPLVSSEDFGGASVTMPHKLLASKVCDEVTDDAKIIGAINTLIPDDSGSQRKIVGENTDWLGLLSTIETLKTIEMGKLETGLVIGAGYAIPSFKIKNAFVLIARPEEPPVQHCMQCTSPASKESIYGIEHIQPQKRLQSLWSPHSTSKL